MKLVDCHEIPSGSPLSCRLGYLQPSTVCSVCDFNPTMELILNYLHRTHCGWAINADIASEILPGNKTHLSYQ